MALNYIYSSSIPLMQEIQARFSEYDYILESISKFSDPAYAFIIIVPVCSTLDTILTANILMVSIIAEWMNTVMKWFISEDRPYWWIREYNANKLGYPYLKQTSLTCETGPGCPSGHVMGFAALLFVVCNSFIKKFASKNEQSALYKNMVRFIVWNFYIISLVLVSISRMYHATHFPHQCLLGAILGYLIGYYFGNNNSKTTKYWHSSTKLRILFFVMIATIISVSAYWILKALGIDPQWSVKLAFKWCERVEHVHVNTTPLYSLVRDTGLGLGMVSISPLSKQSAKRHNLLVSMAIVLVYVSSLNLAQMSVPSHDVKIFYGCHMLLYSTLPYVLLQVLPKVATVKRKTR